MVHLDDWVAQVCEALELPRDSVDQGMVLDLARDVARAVNRPAAPLTAYLAGVAVGRGVPPDQARRSIEAILPPPAPSED